ncbi:MAG: non-homologous end-joining DNA ligase [Burkholderiales bacterium]|nr:non-homologous end-joining DNA ligase [Burkholderiales bacterium]
MTAVRIGSRSIELSNLEKVLFPDAGITKGDVIEYYRAVADVMLAHARDRAVTLQRFPDGIGKKGFIQQKRSGHFPQWIDGVRVRRVGRKGGTIEHVVCNDQATLVYLAGQAVLTFHLWLSRTRRIDKPDRLIFDLDPPHGDDFAPVVQGARRVRDLMHALGLTPYVMTTGSSGLHVVAPLRAAHGFDEVRAFARAMADYLARRYPDALTVEQRKNKRRGRLYLDVMRNSWAQTSVAPYALRAKPGAPVATPLEWDELARPDIGAQRYTLANLRRRLGQRGDPWADIDRHRAGIGPARRALEALAGKLEEGEGE